MSTYLVRKLEKFARLSQDDREALAAVMAPPVRVVEPRRDLIREGDPPRVISAVVSGWACRYKTLPDGRRQIVAFFVPGDLCDLNIYLLREMDHNIGAITTLKIAEISPQQFDEALYRRPRILQALWWNELVVTATQREWTLNIGQRSAYERLAHLMAEMYIRLEAVGLASNDSLDWPLTQTDLADATGLTAVHVNRTLQQMRKDKLIELEHKRLNILDMDRLKGVAIFNDNYLHLHREGAHLDANA